jgi:hypothetical protein
MAQPGDGGALDAMAQPGASDGRCDYERQRDANIVRSGVWRWPALPKAGRVESWWSGEARPLGRPCRKPAE